MTPLQFWKCTPRKLAALCSVHAKLNNPKENKGKVPNNSFPDSSRGGVGKPDTFIDQLDYK